MSRRMISATAQGVIATIPMSFVNDPSHLPLTTEFSYRPEDPFAVSAVFRTPSQTVTWTFGRELLAQGMHEHAGFGDVLTWPKLSRRGTALTVLELCSPDGVVQVEGLSRDIARFLDAAFRLVPLGEEHRHLEIERELAALLC